MQPVESERENEDNQEILQDAGDNDDMMEPGEPEDEILQDPQNVMGPGECEGQNKDNEEIPKVPQDNEETPQDPQDSEETPEDPQEIDEEGPLDLGESESEDHEEPKHRTLDAI